MNSGNIFSIMDMEKAKSKLEARRESEKRACNTCGKESKLKEFRGRIIRHLDSLQVSFSTRCRTCERKNRGVLIRSPLSNKANVIWGRSRRMGVKSDLKLKDIEMIISCPCFHCGIKSKNMEISMRNESMGYIKKNSIPSCERCLKMKSMMSEQAWKTITPKLREMVREGLLNSNV